MEAKQVPLIKHLASVPADARLVIDDADGMGTRYILVGRLCHEAAAAITALRERLAQPEQESFSPEAISATQAAWKMGYDAAKAEQPEQKPVPWESFFKRYCPWLEQPEQEPTAKRAWFTIAELNALADKKLSENPHWVMPKDKPERDELPPQRKPGQEPVAWLWRCKPHCSWPEWSVSLKRPADAGCDGNKRTEGYEDIPLYTAPPQRKPEQEPVAWLDGPHLVVRLDMRNRLNYQGPWVDLGRAIPDKWIPFLFTAPPQRKGEA